MAFDLPTIRIFTELLWMLHHGPLQSERQQTPNFASFFVSAFLKQPRFPDERLTM
jgi:hypothetical protein